MWRFGGQAPCYCVAWRNLNVWSWLAVHVNTFLTLLIYTSILQQLANCCCRLLSVWSCCIMLIFCRPISSFTSPILHENCTSFFPTVSFKSWNRSSSLLSFSLSLSPCSSLSFSLARLSSVWCETICCRKTIMFSVCTSDANDVLDYRSVIISAAASLAACDLVVAISRFWHHCYEICS